MPSPVRRKLITDAVVGRAESLASCTVYRGEITGDPPSLPNSDRVDRYLVIYPMSFGVRGPDTDLGEAAEDALYGFQATVVAGFPTDCEFLADQVDALFHLWVPAIDGLVFGRFRPPPGYDAGPIRPDRDVQPPRFWVPLQYQITATT